MMKNFKLTLCSIVLILVMLFSLVSCTDEIKKPSDTDGDEPSGSDQISGNGGDSDKGDDSDDDKKTDAGDYASRNYKFSEIGDKIKLLGRSQVTSDGVQCDFTASGVAFKAYVKNAVRFTVNCSKDTYFTVIIDGERQGGNAGRYLAKGGTDTTITINGLGDMALREIRILKETEPQHSLTVLKKLSFYGALEGAAEDKDLYIEFLGDSITCGYGNLIADNVDDDNAWRPVNSDGTRAYAFLAAEQLKADSSIISCSGIGIDNGWTSFNEMDFYTKASYFRDKTAEYDFSSARVPDVVVINLGTNDYGRGSEEDEFKSNVVDLIDFIRTSYGKDMPIVWAYNMMGECRADWVNDVFETMGGENARLYSVMLNENRKGGNGHPTTAAHETAANTLATFISKITLPTADKISYSTQTYNFAQETENIKLVGRTLLADDGIICDYTASGIEFKAYIEGNFKFTVNCSRDTYFTVMVDGVRMARNVTDPTERFFAAGGSDVTIDVGDLGDMALHEIRILKQTEPQNSLCVMKSMSFRGTLCAAAKDAELYIEFLGDSITCGYGNLTNGGGNETGTALYQDGTKTYAFLAAEQLGADASVISCSGIGIDKGWTSFNEMTFYTKASYFRNNSTIYSFSNVRVPDVVVINLGTNDKNRGSTEAQFKQNAKELINFIRTSYGKNVPIVWAYNMAGECCFEWTSAVLAELGGEANGLYSVQLIPNNAGGNGHPTLQAQTDNAAILAEFIKSKGLNVK